MYLDWKKLEMDTTLNRIFWEAKTSDSLFYFIFTLTFLNQDLWQMVTTNMPKRSKWKKTDFDQY